MAREHRPGGLALAAELLGGDVELVGGVVVPVPAQKRRQVVEERGDARAGGRAEGGVYEEEAEVRFEELG